MLLITHRDCLLHEMQKRKFTRLLEYGKYNGTPVGELDLDTGRYRGAYLDYLTARLDAPRAFLEGAIAARQQARQAPAERKGYRR